MSPSNPKPAPLTLKEFEAAMAAYGFPLCNKPECGEPGPHYHGIALKEKP